MEQYAVVGLGIVVLLLAIMVILLVVRAAMRRRERPKGPLDTESVEEIRRAQREETAVEEQGRNARFWDGQS